MVVPRSAVQIERDDEFTLFSVTTFKKTSTEFIHKCRENKWTPRDFKYKEGGREEEQKEVEKVEKDEKKVWGEALRLGRTAWGEAVMAWVHVLALRVFVETVLRYGLPLSFVCGLVRVSLSPVALPLFTQSKVSSCPIICETSADCYLECRQRQSWLNGYENHSMTLIHTLLAMRLAGTKRVE